MAVMKERHFARFECWANIPYCTTPCRNKTHDDVIKWKHLPRYWPFVRGIHRSPVNSPHKGQLRWALMFSFICAWTNGSVNNPEAGDLRRHLAHYDVIVMLLTDPTPKVIMITFKVCGHTSDHISLKYHNPWNGNEMRPCLPNIF